jgi:hypothetical protein
VSGFNGAELAGEAVTSDQSLCLASTPHQSERKSIIRLLSDNKNPAGAGIFVERRNISFSGMMRVSEPFPPAVPLTCLYPDHIIGL